MNYTQAKRQTLDEFDDPENEAWLSSYLDVFAHNLAQVQRGMLASDGYEQGCVCGGCGYCTARDLIDAIDPRSTP